jgi:hypothetical protein
MTRNYCAGIGMVAPEIGMPLRVPSATAEIPEIDREMERLAKAAHSLQELLNVLGSRLARISHPQPAACNEKLAEADAPIGTSLGEEIRETRLNLEQTARIMRGHIDALAI